MWCKSCRQDVPALPSGDQQGFCCPRCGASVCADLHRESAEAKAKKRRKKRASKELDAQPAPSVSPKTTPADAAAFLQPPPYYDDWEMGEQLREIERALQGDQSSEQSSGLGCRHASARIDPPHAANSPWHIPAAGPVILPFRPRKEKRAKDVASSVDRDGSTPGSLIWTTLSLGTSGLVCGGILMIWSLIAGRQELWNVGLPAALGGQVALLVGLVLQLDRLWRDHRTAATKLDAVDDQIHDLKTATTLLGTTQGPTAAAFYTHFAGGAGPKLLLADLKGQIDLLATKLSQED